MHKKNRDLLTYWLAILRFSNFSPKIQERILKNKPDLNDLFSSDKKRFIDQEALIDWAVIEQDLCWAEEPGNHILFFEDPNYPSLLKEIPYPPPILFAKGNLGCLDHPKMAIVGSRNPTWRGKEIAGQISFELSKLGFTIVSGLALGIDAAAHQGALKAIGSTWAVLGNGVDVLYPKAHFQLAHKIINEGLLLSEFPLRTSPLAINFPKRNRIISGLSLGTLVVEAAEKSGSLITAKFALEQNREVFAIPGSTYSPLSRGCHHLIRQGSAKLVESVKDILEEFNELSSLLPLCAPDLNKLQIINNLKKEASLTKPLRNLLRYIDFEITPLDTIVEKSGLTTGLVSSMLLELEMEKWIVSEPGGYSRLGLWSNKK